MGTGLSRDAETSSQPQTKEDHTKNINEKKPIEITKHGCANTQIASNVPKPDCKNKATESKSLELEAAHGFRSIIGISNSIGSSSSEELLNQLHKGILLDQNQQKYWVDKNGKNCFVVYARNLSITWAEESRYWIWRQLNDGSDESTIVFAELLNVCWLEVVGKFDTRKLSPGTLYEVSFVVMIKEQAYGWDVPVNVALVLPSGGKIERKVDISAQPKGQWVDIIAGTIRAQSDQNQPGEMIFSMYEYEGGKWKKGLLIKGVKIQPKNL